MDVILLCLFPLKIFDDNKTYWQRIKSLFSDKQKSLQSDIILVENDIITSDKRDVADKLNTFFMETVENLGIVQYVSKRMYFELQMKSNQKSYWRSWINIIIIPVYKEN